MEANGGQVPIFTFRFEVFVDLLLISVVAGLQYEQWDHGMTRVVA